MPDSHAKLSPSAAHRWIHCPGSIRLYASLPVKPAGEYAAIGTVAHSLAESELKQHASGIKEPMFLKKLLDKVEKSKDKAIMFKQDGFDVAITAEMINNVSLYTEYVMEALADTDGTYVLNVEKKFDLSWLVPGMFGTNDSSLVSTEPHRPLYIFDYKNGRTQVDAKDNEQMMIYALGALGERNESKSDDVCMTIFQPNCFTRSANNDSFVMSSVDLYLWAYDVLVPAAEDTKAVDAPCKPGTWCAFCEASGICPAKRDQIVSVFPEIKSDNPKLPDIGTLSPEEVSKLSKFFGSKDFKAWVQALAATEFDLLSRGVSIPGRRLEEKEVKGDREWSVSPEELAKAIPDIDVFEKKLRSPASVERELKQLKTMDKAALSDLLSSVTMRPISTKTIVVDGDEAGDNSNILKLFN